MIVLMISGAADVGLDEVVECMQQEMLQKLIELQQDLVGIDSLLQPNRVCLPVCLLVCLFACLSVCLYDANIHTTSI